MSNKTELERKEILRLSNEESNKITKECIETALLLLMKENEFKDISISDIVKRAGVSRTAYYRNYKSKEDILNKHLETVVKAISNKMDFTTYSEDRFGYWHSIFSQIRNYSNIFLILLRADFEWIILSSINKIMLDDLPSDSISSKEKYDIYFWSGAVFNILTEWISSGMKESEEEMAQICCEVIAEADS
ncbi:TetR/AcrR family transcriptional regulator [Ureibacillus aquaedulcis]|uniref:TetR/AcrR family transcriptional regulator n=1 Tax=Ureibacillus aquaedulcis TaxID=3058421 RepID=A0ABT8GW27_9BACL|nr:TetR/AcrR family transcriptional regulator [Ureibacillus sp. BA0131]MDN4495606.1 TetR/AcrR family transcriptional regulator [Ureibacillus sp. BA0131]